MNASRRPDAIVVGAGIVGAACAAALATDGWRVTILERAFASAGTTSVGMGHVVVMDDSRDQLALTTYSDRLWRELGPELDARSELDKCGTLWVAEDDAQLEAVRTKQSVYASAGIASEVLDEQGLHEAEPCLRPGLVGALLVPGDSVVYPPGATLRLLARAKAHGAVLREGVEVVEFLPHGVRCKHETLSAEVIVNATGAAAALLTPALPIVPRKGHLAITDRYPGFCRHQLVELGYLTSAHVMTNESVAFNIQPRPTGQLLIGSSRELVGWNASVNYSVLRQMLARATEFIPGLGHLSIIRCWTGFRPATPDKLPLIGRWEPTPGLWIAAGHEGLGITTSLATARLLADQVAGRQTEIDAAPFAPARVLSESYAEPARHE
ncbi:MAG TPA: FAD-dependent oxidoreductase [Gemmatimonadaceae bacterium]